MAGPVIAPSRLSELTVLAPSWQRTLSGQNKSPRTIVAYIEKAYRVFHDTLVNVPGRKVTADPFNLEIMLGDWESASSDLHAIIGRAALERAPLYAPFDPHNYGILIELQGDELEAVLRPIFDESGIGHRFFRDRAAFKAAVAAAAEEETAQASADS